MDPKPKKKSYLLVWVVIVLILIGVYWWLQTEKAGRYEQMQESQQPATSVDATTEISKDLESINLDGLESEFQSIDTDLNAL